MQLTGHYDLIAQSPHLSSRDECLYFQGQFIVFLCKETLYLFICMWEASRFPKFVIQRMKNAQMATSQATEK